MRLCNKGREVAYRSQDGSSFFGEVVRDGAGVPAEFPLNLCAAFACCKYGDGWSVYSHKINKTIVFAIAVYAMNFYLVSDRFWCFPEFRVLRASYNTRRSGGYIAAVYCRFMESHRIFDWISKRNSYISILIVVKFGWNVDWIEWINWTQISGKKTSINYNKACHPIRHASVEHRGG